MNQYAKEKRVKWVLLIIVGFAASFSLLSYAMETIPMGSVLRGLDRNWHRRRGAYRHPLLQGAERRQTDLLYRVDFMLSGWFKNSVIN
nr:SMR family transporter [Bacillus subtilis]